MHLQAQGATGDLWWLHRCEREGDVVVAVHNLADRPRRLCLEVDDGERLCSVLERGVLERDERGLPACLDGYGYGLRGTTKPDRLVP